MSDEEEKPPFAAALRFLTDRERRLLADHPSPRELAAYHAGELLPEAEARIREHLALCRDCSDLLLNLAGVKKLTPPPGMPELTDEEVEEDWQAVRAKLEEERKPAEVVPIRPTPPATTIHAERGVWPWKLLAAASTIVAVALGLWVLALTRGQAASGPVTVLDSGDVLRDAGVKEIQRLPSDHEGVFRFHFSESFTQYEGEILRLADNKVVWNRILTPSAIKASPEGEITAAFGVPADTLSPGEYRAQLIGISKGRRGVITSLSFQVDGS